MGLELEGKIIEIIPEVTGQSQKGAWVSQDFVLQTQEDYPKTVCFSIFGRDKIAEANLGIGDVVNVGINIESRNFKGRYYTSVKAWRVRKIGSAPQQTQKAAPQQQTVSTVDSGDDLPF